jgi:hypothetical protein
MTGKMADFRHILAAVFLAQTHRFVRKTASFRRIFDFHLTNRLTLDRPYKEVIE